MERLPVHAVYKRFRTRWVPDIKINPVTTQENTAKLFDIPVDSFPLFVRVARKTVDLLRLQLLLCIPVLLLFRELSHTQVFSLFVKR